MSAATKLRAPKTAADSSAAVPPGYKRTEVGVIPEDWELYPVRRMGEVLIGKALAASAPGAQRPYLRTKTSSMDASTLVMF